MFKINKVSFCIVFLITIMFTINISISAVERNIEITLSEAFEIAENSNIEISEGRKNYEISKNKIKKINKNQDWKFSLNNNFVYNKNDEYDGLKNDLTLSLNRRYYSGLMLSSKIGIIEREPFDFNNIEEQISYNLNISLPLYPNTPTEKERKLLELKDNFEIAKLNFINLINKKEINWLEDYLTILRLKETIFLRKEKESFLLDDLNKNKKEYDIGEIGKYDLLEAEISLEELRTNLKSLENQLEQQKKYFYNNLGLENKYKVKFSKKDDFLMKIKEKTKDNILNSEINIIHSRVKENDIELNSLKKELKRKTDKYKNLRKKRGIELETKTYYQNNSLIQNENLEISLGLSWDIFDKELDDIELEEHKREIDHLKKKIAYLENYKIIEANAIFAENEIYNLKKENSLMKLKNKKREIKNSKIKYKEGLISKKEFAGIKFKYKERENEKLEITDKILINNLEILNLIGEY